MNSTLQLKGTFEQRKNDAAFGSPNLPAGESINSEKLEELLSDLERLYDFWQKDNTVPGALVSVYYNKIAAKSNRIQRILSSGNNSIRGARYDNSNSLRHIITHYVSLKELEQSINEVKQSIPFKATSSSLFPFGFTLNTFIANLLNFSSPSLYIYL